MLCKVKLFLLLTLLHYVTGVPYMKGSSLKCHQDKLGRGCASDVDHSYEHSVHGMTCCYAGGKHSDVLGFRRHS